MKYLILFSLFTFSLHAQELSLKDLVLEVSTRNYTVLESAHQTYQSSEGVEAARSQLLPNLNVWQIHEIVTPWGWLGAVKDIAPFLVPANWFRADQNKKLFKVQEEAYHAVWANQILKAKALYLRTLQDLELLSQINNNTKNMQFALEVAKTRELLGAQAPGMSMMLELRVLALKEDQRNLESILFQARKELAAMAAFDPSALPVLRAIDLPELEQLEEIEVDDFSSDVVASSPELKQYDALIEVVPSIKKEIMFSFLGTSAIERGLAGGVFDDVPMPSGLGFGRGTSLRILRSKEEMLKHQRQGVKENLLRQLHLVVANYNRDLRAFNDTKRRVETGKLLFQALLDRSLLGAPLDVLEFIEVSRELLAAQTAQSALYTRFMLQQDRLDRMLLQNDYVNKPDFAQLIKN